MEDFRKGPINKTGSSRYKNPPKTQWYLSLIIKGLSNIQLVLMFPFHHRILLRSFYTAKLVEDALFMHKIFQHKFWCIIKSDALDSFVELSPNIRTKNQSPIERPQTCVLLRTTK